MSFGIAFLGLDHWYTAIGMLETAMKSGVCPLVGVMETDVERLEWVRAKYCDIVVTTDPSELFTHDDVALVAICAATDLAPPLAKAALQAGKHVISVKPPARTLTELEDVMAVAEASGKFYGSFESLQRLAPANILLRELIQSGAIGIPMSFHQVAHGGLPKPWPDTESGADSWWLHHSQVPGGAWIDHAIYAVDLARYVFDGEVVQAVGFIENRVHRDLELEDYGMALVRLTTREAQHSVSVLMEDTWTAEPGGGRGRKEFLGSAGYILQEGNEWVVRGVHGEKRHPIPNDAPSGLDALALLLQSHQSPPFGPRDAHANLKACLEVYAFGRSGP